MHKKVGGRFSGMGLRSVLGGENITKPGKDHISYFHQASQKSCFLSISCGLRYSLNPARQFS
jgi:hypothetical protein